MLVEVQGCQGRCDWSSEGEGVVGNELGQRAGGGCVDWFIGGGEEFGF